MARWRWHRWRWLRWRWRRCGGWRSRGCGGSLGWGICSGRDGAGAGTAGTACGFGGSGVDARASVTVRRVAPAAAARSRQEIACRGIADRRDAIARLVSSPPAFRHMQGQGRTDADRRKHTQHGQTPKQDRPDHGASPLDCAGALADGEGNRCLRPLQSHRSATAARAAL